METFEELLAARAAASQSHYSSLDQKSALQTFLREGFCILSELHSELEAATRLKHAETLSIEKIVSSLQSYRDKCTVDMRADVPYQTARLAAVGMEKVIEKRLKSQSDMCDEPEDQSDPLQDLLAVMDELNLQNKFNISSFVGLFAEMGNVPLDILYHVHLRNLVPFTTYIYHNRKKMHVLSKLEEDLVALMASQVDSDLDMVITELLTVLVRVGHGTEIDVETSRECVRVCCSILEGIMQKTAELLTSGSASDVPTGRHFILLRERLPLLSSESLKGFLSAFLKVLLHHQPHGSLQEAVGRQKTWVTKELPRHYSVFLENLLKALGARDALETMKTFLLANDTINWRVALEMLSTYITCLPSAPQLTKGFVDWLLLQSLSTHSRQMLAIAFMVARQACTLSAAQQSFPSYTAWFGATFGSEARQSTTATSRSAFEFFMQFLTESVPHDAPLYLRVHINKVPQAPANCASLLSDYIALAKTRLKDLGEAVGGGLFGFELTPEEDVSQALAQFEQTGQVSRIVLDATIFRRQQYEEEFLPCLLKPRPVTSETDLRIRFISKLYSAGKIAHALYQKYESDCQALGATSDSLNLDGYADNEEKWKAVLNHLVDAVKDNCEAGGSWEPPPMRISQAINAATTLLQEMMSDCPSRQLQKMVVARFFKMFVACHQAVNETQLLHWPRLFMNVLQSYPKLIRFVFIAVRDLCSQKNLQEHTTKAVALLMHTMDSMKLNLTFSLPSLAVAISEEIASFTTKEEMIHYFRLFSQYLYCAECGVSSLDLGEAKQVLEEGVPVALLKKYMYLKERLALSEDQAVLSVVERAWDPRHHQELWVSVLSNAQLSMQEWLELESHVRSEQDVMASRQVYVFLWLTKHCPQSKHEVATDLLAASLLYSDEGKDHSKFVRDLLSAVPLVVQQLGEKPWLLSAWEELARSYRHQDIFRVVSGLPSWLLLSNSLASSSECSSLDSLSQFVTKNLKDGMTEQGFLPRSLVWYIFTSVTTLYPADSSGVLSQLVDSCPALHISLLAHAHCLQAILSTSISDRGDNSISRLRQLISVLLSPSGQDATRHYSDKLERVVANSEPWELAILLWNTHTSKYETLEDYLPHSVTNWILFFKLIHFGNLFIENQLKAEFLGEDLTVTNLRKIPKEYSFSYVLEELLANYKVLEILNSFFKIDLVSPFCGLSDCSQAATAIGVTIILASLPAERLRTLNITPLVCQTLRLCRTVWMNAISSTKLWYKLNARYSAHSDGQDLNLLNSSFINNVSQSIKSHSEISWE
ncbi:Fanconi anemia group A protein homolog [Anabrus simplex]|uniref:Fanconi anemia group A protein homolog n=1 Tax=Anabrus simplex TaxID=316456 RepID=UPI0035A28D42